MKGVQLTCSVHFMASCTLNFDYVLLRSQPDGGASPKQLRYIL